MGTLSQGATREGVRTPDGPAAADELRRRFGVTATAADRTLSFQVPSGETFLPDFVRGFGQPLEAVNLRWPTLDDVFLRLTGHEIREEVSTR